MRAGEVAAGLVEGAAAVAVVGAALHCSIAAGEAPLINAAEETVRGSGPMRHARTDRRGLRLIGNAWKRTGPRGPVYPWSVGLRYIVKSCERGDGQGRKGPLG